MIIVPTTASGKYRECSVKSRDKVISMEENPDEQCDAYSLNEVLL